MLVGENRGKLIRETTHKLVSNQNYWTFELASDIKESEPTVIPKVISPTEIL